MRIVGDNTILRTVNSGDLDILLQWENDATVAEFNVEKESISRESLQNFIDGNHDIYMDNQLRLMITLAESEEAIGTIDLFEYDRPNSHVGVGILIFEPKNRKHGYASESMDNVIRYASKHLDIKKIFCNIDSSNTASVSFFKSKGFIKQNIDISKISASKNVAGLDFYTLDLKV